MTRRPAHVTYEAGTVGGGPLFFASRYVCGGCGATMMPPESCEKVEWRAALDAFIAAHRGCGGGRR